MFETSVEAAGESAILSKNDALKSLYQFVTVDMAVFSIVEEPEDDYRRLPSQQLCILLVKRGENPHAAQWVLPSGFVRPDETVGRAARREMRDEAGLSNIYMEQLYTFNKRGYDTRTWVTNCAYMALADTDRLYLRPGGDVQQAAWFRMNCQLLSEKRDTTFSGCTITYRYQYELVGASCTINCGIEHKVVHTREAISNEYAILESDGLAYDNARIIACALDRLRGKLEYTSIALHLMPARFTLTELQKVYEIILGKPLLPAAFRRKIAGMVRGTDQYTSSAGHRPSQLFERDWEGIARMY